MMNWLRSHLVANLGQAHKWASMRLHGAAILIAAVYQAMPILDPQIAAMLPAPMAARAIGVYAIIGALARVIQIRQRPVA